MTAPQLGPDQVLVRVEACAIGPDELRALRGDGAPGMGIGAAGTVERAGDAASHLLGARVAVGPFDPCGECDLCRRGEVAACPHRDVRPAVCDGRLVRHAVANARWLCRIDGPLALPGPPAALLAREAAIAYQLVCEAGATAGDAIAIAGGGPTAALAAQLAAARGVRLAGDGAEAARVIETSGTDDGRRAAADRCAPAARVVLWAPADRAPTAVDALAQLARRAAWIRFVAGAHPDLVPELAALAVKGDVDLAAVADPVAADVPIEDLARRIAAGDRVPVVTW